MHLWVKGIQVDPALFQGDIITKKRKYMNKILKSSSPEPLSKFQPNLAQSILVWRGFKYFFSSLNKRYDIFICVYWFELFSHVSGVAHGPLVKTVIYTSSNWGLSLQSVEEYRLNADEELRFEVEANATVQMEVSALYRGKFLWFNWR